MRSTCRSAPWIWYVDSFCQLESLPMCKYFSLDVVMSASEAGVSRVWDESAAWRGVEPWERRCPCLRVLPMSCSWCVYFCQEVLEELMSRAEMGPPGSPEGGGAQRIARPQARSSVRHRPARPGAVQDNGCILAWD